uniref:Uncharacterized protein n=1 Tax=Acrobeloides nanus TaxID=290746 RepID=A0A914EEF1_9BILA
MLIWKKVQWLPGALAVQAASSVGWLALILIYIVLLVDHMNKTKLSTPSDLAEANQINVTEVPKHYSSTRDASNSARMVSITAELLVVLLSQIYLTYMYYGIYQDDRRRQIVKASLNFAAITPMELYPSAYERNRVYDTIDPYITVRSMYTIQKGQNTINLKDFR